MGVVVGKEVMGSLLFASFAEMANEVQRVVERDGATAEGVGMSGDGSGVSGIRFAGVRPARRWRRL